MASGWGYQNANFGYNSPFSVNQFIMSEPKWKREKNSFNFLVKFNLIVTSVMKFAPLLRQADWKLKKALNVPYLSRY